MRSRVVQHFDLIISAADNASLLRDHRTDRHFVAGRGLAVFPLHKIVVWNRNLGRFGMRLAVKDTDENPTSSSRCAIASRLAK